MAKNKLSAAFVRNVAKQGLHGDGEGLYLQVTPALNRGISKGVYAPLVAAHVGERGAAQSDIKAKDAALAAKLESQIHIVADLNRRLGQIDTTIEEAAKRGRTNAALSAIDSQRKARAALVDERNRDAGAL